MKLVLILTVGCSVVLLLGWLILTIIEKWERRLRQPKPKDGRVSLLRPSHRPQRARSPHVRVTPSDTPPASKKFFALPHNCARHTE
jgi:hypothetical protein